jgi:hypothetical protein
VLLPAGPPRTARSGPRRPVVRWPRLSASPARPRAAICERSATGLVGWSGKSANDPRASWALLESPRPLQNNCKARLAVACRRATRHRLRDIELRARRLQAHRSLCTVVTPLPESPSRAGALATRRSARLLPLDLSRQGIATIVAPCRRGSRSCEGGEKDPQSTVCARAGQTRAAARTRLPVRLAPIVKLPRPPPRSVTPTHACT